MNEGVFILGKSRTGGNQTRRGFQMRLKLAFAILDKKITTLLSTLIKKDSYTTDHQRRVSQLVYAIADEMDFSEEKAKCIHRAGLIHDIGKITVPAKILTKPGRLTRAEFDIVKDHVRVGFKILKLIGVPLTITNYILQHHERLDGSGYPHGLKDGHILLEARILAVADVVEALRSDRPYRSARSITQVLEEILQNKGVLYDSDVVDVCVKLFKRKGFKFK